MPPRSGNRKRKRSPSSRARKRQKSATFSRLLGIFVIVLAILGIGYLIKYKAIFDGKFSEKKTIIFEEPSPPQKIQEKKQANSVPARHLPRIAIVIDDMGYEPGLDAAFIKLDAPFSFSLLPFAPHTKETAILAYNYGKEVLLHLPMEPASGPESKVGPGALFLSMDDNTISTQLQADMAAVPYIKGVNNHMGSKFTADADKMKIVLHELRKRGLFYLDSRTTPLTKGLLTARLTGVKSAERDVFLDNMQEANAVRGQIARLISVARAHGSAIGIGHPHPVTYQVLKEDLSALKEQVKIVSISELVE